jgi:branched-chain amino acid transport system substrate-binding protein
MIYYPIFIAAGGHITRQAKEVSGLANTKLMGADGMFSPDFLKAAGDAPAHPPRLHPLPVRTYYG